MQFRVRDRNAETRAKQTQFIVVQFFLLVSNVFALTCLTQSISFNSLGQNNGGPSGVIHCSFIRSVDLNRIMTSQPHTGELFVGEMLNHL